MRTKKLIPFIFLAILIILITFIVGMRYGKHIESLNYAYERYPTPSPLENLEYKENREPAISFLLYQNTPCEVEFLYPDILTVNEASTSAVFTDKQSSVIEIDCATTDSPKEKETKTILFQNEPIEAMLIKDEPNEQYFFTIAHPINNKNISFTVNPAYLSLLGRTLQYELSE